MGYFVAFLTGAWAGMFLLAILSAGSDSDQ